MVSLTTVQSSEIGGVEDIYSFSVTLCSHKVKQRLVLYRLLCMPNGILDEMPKCFVMGGLGSLEQRRKSPVVCDGWIGVILQEALDTVIVVMFRGIAKSSTVMTVLDVDVGTVCDEYL